ncbi:Oidioi.mRNA.OKI2018_I69.chr1.g706.t1.cds [Oikopleura dioica]|uniref:Oidioi.mRNA.OKI2018_I69.chr1.g706.t1.cds n=1 Tax=Oikopleura dioica TaxID=34765 RepID=A0ABN7SRZ6_OIKDI|nr:Oidioi.mRNA.OKI2018_I69.chr1.g706.t1.cds [Oikopleura dioica]
MLRKGQRLNTCGSLRCIWSPVTPADACDAPEERKDQLNLQVSMACQSASYWYANNLVKMVRDGENKEEEFKNHLDTLTEKHHYDWHEVKSFYHNVKNHSNINAVLEKWESLKQLSIIKIARRDKNVDEKLEKMERRIGIHLAQEECGLADLDLGTDSKGTIQKTLHKICEEAFLSDIQVKKLWHLACREPGLSNKKTNIYVTGEATNLYSLEEEIATHARWDRLDKKFTLVYLYVDSDEAPLLVMYNGENPTILDSTQDDWTFKTKTSWTRNDRKISEILQDSESKPLLRYNDSTQAVILSLTGEQFKTTAGRKRRNSASRPLTDQN